MKLHAGLMPRRPPASSATHGTSSPPTMPAAFCPSPACSSKACAAASKRTASRSVTRGTPPGTVAGWWATAPGHLRHSVHFRMGVQRAHGKYLGNKWPSPGVLTCVGGYAGSRNLAWREPMLDLSRRDFVVSTGLAAALGLNARLVVPAFAQKTPDPPKGFVTYKVGSAEVTAIYDGIWEKPHDPAFIANASVDDVKAAMVKAGLPADFVSIPFTVVVVKTGGKTILCDSGTGGQLPVQPPAGKLAANMKAAGIDPAKIDTILISHFHPDHIFGLMEKDTNKPVYPDVEIIVSDVEYKFWTDPAVIDRLPEARKGLARRIQAVFPTWKNIRQVAGEPEVAPGIRFVSAPGHTPGHRAFHLASGGKELMISNDTAYVPALVVANPGWHGQYDQDAAMAEASRHKLLDRVIADKIQICGYHFPFPAAGTIAKDGTGYALTVMKT